jgi:hypothetical protein
VSDNPIRILSDAELAAMPRPEPVPEPPAAPAPVVVTCYEWGNLAAVDAAHAQAALQELGLPFSTKSQQDPGAGARYWVYIPPQRNLARAQEKIRELKALGVKDSIIIKDPKWHHTISLGLFADEALAEQLMQKLRGKGVKNAIKARRGKGANTVSLIINDVLPDQALKLAELTPRPSHGQLSPVNCE